MKLSVSFNKTLVSYNEVADINGLIERIVAFAHRHKYENKKVGRDTLVIQKSDTWLMLTGLSASLRISISIEPGKTEVILSDYVNEFRLKQFVFLTTFLISSSLFLWSYFAAYPLPIFLILIFPIYGAFRQYRLMEDIKTEIDDYFSERLAKPTKGWG
ncbi:hypothetical protein [Nostoc sp. C117]|uniref:hypothetical protein n=1 Tax=Nostoc sp. C117 TaxID=3349875 RepID=UPI00370D2722